MVVLRQRPSRARRAVRVVMGLLVLGLLVAGAFRGWAAVRERHGREELAPPSGRFVSAAGLALFLEEAGPTTGRPVVMIHGAMAWSGTFRPLLDTLADGGYRAIAIDVPPFGFSERPAAHDYDRRAQARRIGALLDALDLRDVVLLGHSFGAGATVETAMTRRDRVTGLVLLAGALGLDELASNAEPPALPLPLALGSSRDVLVAMSATNPWATGAVLRSMMENDDAVTDARVAIYQAPFGVEGLTPAVGRWVTGGLFADEHASVSAAEAAYRAYDAPTLLVWGRGDTVTPLAQGEALSGWLPRDQLVVLEGVGHIPHAEEPDGVGRAVLAFLRGEGLDAPPAP